MRNTAELLTQFKETRARTEWICSFLENEDFVVQPIVDVSPPKWHLGHTTWFFEEFLLKKLSHYSLFDANFAFIFNSYYESVGEKVIRANRGNLTRPSVKQVMEYRSYITSQLSKVLERADHISEEFLELLELGIHHEKQHQELLITDIKYILGNNPLFPKYTDEISENPSQEASEKWISVEEGIYEIGHDRAGDFSYDNELGRHKVFLHAFEISNKLVTNREYLEFMEAGGYQEVLLWHSEAWEWLKTNHLDAPLYWHKIKDDWFRYSLKGLHKIEADAPVTHISYYEAFAFAQWKQLRLPTEFEWEVAEQHFNWGSRWEWTESAYLPYPGYSKAPGALGEYNGKFMVNQKVLRGSSIATSPKHSRPSYRNFFHPHLRWQFTGIRLAKNQII